MHGVYELFEEVVDLPDAEQAAVLGRAPQAVADAVRALLAAERNLPPILEAPFLDTIERLRDEDEQVLLGLIGSTIGSFRIVEFIAVGGSAAVFKAERPAGIGAQTVALKLLLDGLRSPDAKKRFLREQAILAQLSHPSIARLIEGGVSGAGVPYIAMELVDGVPITQAADDLTLDLERRLAMFLKLCEAVQAAHASLVVHCDLKPGNVLVQKTGDLKVLDFGIGKLLTTQSNADRTLNLALTPEYAAPEQFRREAPSVSVDIFALGVMLGELLTGLRLGSGNPQRMSDAVLGQRLHEPPRGLPERAQLARRLKGDLDAIVTSATAEQANDRYGSVEALRRDVERHLRGFPVRARDPTRLERLQKLVRRHAALAAITSILGLLVLVSSALAIRWGLQSRAAVANAERATLRAESMKDLMLEAFSEARPSASRESLPTILDVVEKALGTLASNQALDEGVRLEMQVNLAEVLIAQGAHARAGEVLRDIKERARRELPADDPIRYQIDYALVKAEAEQGHWPIARAALDTLLAELPPGLDDQRMRALATSAWLASLMEDEALGIAHAEQALTAARALGVPGRIEQALRAKGAVLLAFRRGAEAVPVYQDLLTRQRAQYGDAHERVAAEESGLSRAFRQAGKLEEAERHARAAIAIDEKVYSGPHWHQGVHLNALRNVLMQARDFPASKEVMAKELEILRATQPADHPDVFGTLQSIGVADGMLGDWNAAESNTAAAVRGYEQIGAGRTARGLRARMSHAYAVSRLGRYADARAELAAAIASAGDDVGTDVKADLADRRVRMALDADALNDASADLDALAVLTRDLDAHWQGRTALLRAELLYRQGDPAAARAAAKSAHHALIERSTAAAPDAVQLAMLELLENLTAEPPRHDAPLAAALRYPPFHVQRLLAALEKPR